MKRKDFIKERPFYTALAELIESAASTGEMRGMIIPGGRTPKPLYQRLFQHGLNIPSDFRFILSDERYCPVSSQDSNQGAIVPLLTRAGASREQIIVPDVSLPPDKAVAAYEETISAFLNGGGSIGAALVGVGSDGHVAGIFDDAELESERLVSSSTRKDGLKGITCTPDLFAKAERLIMVLRGAPKQEIVERIAAKPESTVAGRLAKSHPCSEIWFCLE